MSKKMKRVQLYVGLTDYKGRDYFGIYEGIIDAALGQFGVDGATLHEANGRWAGAPDPSVVIEILFDEADLTVENKAYEIAKFLKAAFNQQSVLLTSETVYASFI